MARRRVQSHILLVSVFLPAVMQAQSDYDRHLFFDNSLTPERYFYSSGQLSPPSDLTLDRGRLPVDTLTFFTLIAYERFATPPMPQVGGELQLSISPDRIHLFERDSGQRID